MTGKRETDQIIKEQIFLKHTKESMHWPFSGFYLNNSKVLKAYVLPY